MKMMMFSQIRSNRLFSLTGRLGNSLLSSTGYFLLLLLFASAQQSSCRRRIPSESIVPATSVRSNSFLLQKLENQDVDKINTLSARATIYAENEGMAVEAYANLIWIRDSVLWLNVKKLGIEAARALITRDSVFILNRLEKTYQVMAIDALQREYSLPEGFPLLQQLLLGSAWLSADMDLQASVKDSLHRLSGSNAQFTADYRLEEGSFVLRKEVFLQKRDSRLLAVQFGQFAKLSGAGIFPYLRRIEMFSPETGNARLDLEFSDVEINEPKSYRFEIPPHYQREE